MNSDGGWKAALALLGAAGAILVLAATTRDLGVSPNSVIYLSAGESLAEGRGLVALKRAGGFGPLTHFPPLLPALIAAFSVLGLEPLAALRWLNALLLGGSAVMVALLTRRAGGSAPRAVAAAGLLLVSLSALESHVFALSEPAWLFLSLTGIYLLLGFLTGGPLRNLVWASAVLALALLTRYAGVALVGWGAAWLLVLPRAGWRERIRNAVLLAGVAGIPIALWIARNLLVSATAVNRRIVFHPPGGADLAGFSNTVSGWVLPLGAPAWVKVVGTCFVIGVIAAASSRYLAGAAGAAWSDRRRALWALIASAALAYILLIGATRTLMDAAVSMDRRTVLPVLAIVLVLVFGAPQRGAPRGRAAFQLAGWLLVGTLALFSAARSAALVAGARREGLRFSSERWRESPLIADLGRLPPGTPIYTNSVEAVYHLARREARLLPLKLNKFVDEPNPRYAEQMEKVGRDLRAGTGVVAYFRGSGRGEIPDAEEIVAALELTPIRETEIGVLLAPL